MSDPLLVVEGLNAYYGPSHVLQNVSFSVTEQAVAIIGRNGMGKSTLCAAIMGMTPPRTSGSVRLEGTELIGRASYKIAGLGIGYVPQGRRLFPSLSVEEHLRMVAGRNGGPWNMRRVYELFPRLAERKRNGGAQLSGGEQQMLAIGRALLTNPKLLIMDEPSEGLAPTVIEMLVETFGKFEEEGLRMLLVEQNLVVATSLAERQLVMIGGEIAAETTASRTSSSRGRTPQAFAGSRRPLATTTTRRGRPTAAGSRSGARVRCSSFPQRAGGRGGSGVVSEMPPTRRGRRTGSSSRTTIAGPVSRSARSGSWARTGGTHGRSRRSAPSAPTPRG